MNDKRVYSIIREYYSIAAPLLVYESCDKTLDIEECILHILCETQGSAELTDECLKIVEDVRCIQTFADGALLSSTDSALNSVAFDIKLAVLSEYHVNKLKKYDDQIFVEDLKECANIGIIDACKLLAYLSWLGVVVAQNKDVAIRIWSVLSVNGDWSSMKALIYAYRENGDEIGATKWNNIYNILNSEYESFSSVALSSKYADYSEEEVQLANLIMLIVQKNASKEAASINRPMLHYVLESKEDYKTKLERLSSETNYYLVIHLEDKGTARKCGF